ncbi:MAG TPA: DNA polymerase Y family protein [bacterium]|nr:DNA polymerase Y family protein [bacterium]
MRRLACIDVAQLPLQLLRLRHPEWSGQPVAVVEQDKPQGIILFASKEARTTAIRPGMTFAQGVSLAPNLRATVITPGEIEESIRQLTEALHKFSPEVEAAQKEPGIFWMTANGLTPLYSSVAQWARAVHQGVAAVGFRATVVVGYQRFGAYAAAKAKTGGIIVFTDPQQEESAMRRVRLDHLALSPRLRDALTKLHVHTLGDFLRLPAAGLHRRFGAEAKKLYDLASDQAFAPLQAIPPTEKIQQTIQLEPADSDAIRLLFTIKQHLRFLLVKLANQAKALAELEIHFSLEQGLPRVDMIQPAEPTLDERLLIDLVRLRLEAAPLPAAVHEILLTAHEAIATQKQLKLFFAVPKRDLAAGDRALARLRTQFGPEAVVQARLTDGHLPEARFSWEPLTRLVPPQPKATLSPLAMVRRIYAQPFPLAPRNENEPDGWLVRELGSGSVTNVWGPYVISGGWWRKEIHRRYYFVQTHRRELLWIYYDTRRRRWFLHGRVQ